MQLRNAVRRHREAIPNHNPPPHTCMCENQSATTEGHLQKAIRRTGRQLHNTNRCLKKAIANLERHLFWHLGPASAAIAGNCENTNGRCEGQYAHANCRRTADMPKAMFLVEGRRQQRMAQGAGTIGRDALLLPDTCPSDKCGPYRFLRHRRPSPLPGVQMHRTSA